MPTCDMGFEHDAVPEPVVEPVIVDSGPNENDVRIAEIEAMAGIEREKIWTEQRSLDLQAEVERQAGEIAGMREVLDRLMPPEPASVEVESDPVIVMSDSVQESEDEAEAPAEQSAPSPAKKKKSTWLG